MSTGTIDSTVTTETNPEDLDTLYERMMEESKHRQRPTVGQLVRGTKGLRKGHTGQVVAVIAPTEYRLVGGAVRQEDLEPAVTVRWDVGSEEDDFMQWYEYAWWTADV